MSKRVCSLIALAGTLAAAPALAQYNVPPFSLPTVNDVIGSVDFNGAAIPAGTYSKSSCSINWGASVNDAWNDEAIWALVDSPAGTPGAVFYADRGSAPNAPGDPTDITLVWPSAFLDANYTGGNPLHFWHLQTFTGSAATWNDITVTLEITGAVPPPTIDPLNVVNIVVPNLAGSPSTLNLTRDYSAGGTVWFQLEIPTAISASALTFLDISTDGSTAGGADTIIALFRPDGSLVASNDDSVSFLSLLSHGAGFRPLTAFTGPRTGANPQLPAGTYYLGAIAWSAAAQVGPGFTLTTTAPATPGENLVVNFDSGTRAPLAPLPGAVAEVEPNDTKATAQVVAVGATGAITGSTTGVTGTGDTSSDIFRIDTPVTTGIVRYQAELSSVSLHRLALRSQGLTNGVVTAADVLYQTRTPVAVPTNIQWYALGTVGGSVYVSVDGIADVTTAPYGVSITSSPVTPVDGPTGLAAGTITITTEAITTYDTHFKIYDASFNPIAEFSNDDATAATFQSTLARTYVNGTYYIAISNWTLANSLFPALDDAFRSQPIMDFPGVIANASSATLAGDLSFSITDSAGTTPVSLFRNSAYEVGFVKFVVGTGGPTACNSADIAQTDGSAGFDGCVNNGDFQLFFSNFFAADCSATCGILPVVACGPADIAATDGSPGADGCVDNGDFSLFFSAFFSANCTGCAG